MQSDSPESDPRLQKTNPGPLVGTGFVDPCIVYMEATEKGEVPVLFAWWARSSSEIREVGATTHIKLGKVSVLKGRPIPSFGGWVMQDGKTKWNFTSHDLSGELHLTQDNSGWTLHGVPFIGDAYGFQGSLKFIDAQTDAALHKLNSVDSPGNHALFAEKVLSLATVEWPTLTNARASLQIAPKPKSRARQLESKIRSKPRPKSLFRKIISTVFRPKKTELV